MAAPERCQSSRCPRMCSQRSRRLVASLVYFLASLSVTESQQCTISPLTIYARVGDQASFNCSHPSDIPTSFHLNRLSYSQNMFPGYSHNTYITDVFTLFFTRTEFFSEPSSVSCVYSQCTTEPATIHNPGPPNAVDEQSICVQPSLTFIAPSWSAAASFPGYPVTGYTIELRNTTSGSTVFSDTTSMTSITIRDLHANQEYNLSIVTNSGSGNSDPTSKIVMTAPLGSVTSLGSRMGVLLSRAVTLTWSFALEPEVTATPSILLNSMQHSLEELSMMAEVTVEDNTASTTVVLMEVVVEWNGSRWRWMLEEFGGILQSDETVLFVQGPPLAPPSPNPSFVGPTSVALSLSNPPFSHLPITSYTIQYCSRELPTRNTTITVTPGEVQVILENVQPTQRYEVTVYASNAAGMSNGTSVPIPQSIHDPATPTCPSMTDPHWMLKWSTLFEGTMQSQLCIPKQDDSGLATRRCGAGGEWDDPDVSSCHSPEFSQLTNKTTAISMQSCYARVPISGCLQNISSLMIIDLLVELINNSDVIFPSDLEVIAVALQNSTRLQESAITQGFDVSLPIQVEGVVEQYLQVFNAIFSDTHSVGWSLLLKENDTFAGDYLLQSFQRLAMILANKSEGNDSYQHSNFELVIVPVVAEVPVALPNGVVVQVAGAEESGSIVAATVEHVAAVLPPLWPSGITSATSDNVLVIVESSIFESAKDFTPSVTVTFQFSELLYRPKCAQWDFSVDTVRLHGRGAWSTEGVETVSDKWSTQVVCHSSRLGPLTVLTDIQGPNVDFSAEPFSIAFYTGTVLGVIFFCFSLAPLIIFTYQDSKSDERRPILNVSQLNYASVAIVTLIILMAGIESGRNVDTSSTHVSVGCKITAFLLHYCFLTLFMWMFCTVLVAFCLHAEVGRELVKRWWSVLIVAYSSPVVVVVIATPIAHPYYGSELGCWLSAQRGTHWAFFAPAILVALATLVLLVMAMVSVFRNKTEDAAADEDQELLTQRRELIGGIVVYTFVHFPFLCLTWVCGFLYLGTGNAAFAYVYAVLLAVQSAIFASFQMLRIRRIRRFWTETVYSRLKLHFSPVRQPTAPPSVTNPTALTGRYNADGRLIGGISVLNSSDGTPFDVTEDTGTSRTDETYLYMW